MLYSTYGRLLVGIKSILNAIKKLLLNVALLDSVGLVKIASVVLHGELVVIISIHISEFG